MSQSDWVGSADVNDYYRFVLAGTSNVSMVLSGLSADADLQLLNSSGAVITGSYNGGSTTDSISSSLSAGTYYARVYQYSGDTNYNLSISGTSSTDGAGNTMGTARDLGTPSGPQTFNDWVGSSDANDYYRFVLLSSSNLSLVLSGLSADADLQLLSSSGSVIAGSYNGGSTTDNISTSLSAGTYYARVFQYSGDTNYTLTGNATNANDGAGNTTGAANDLGSLSGSQVVNDWVGSSDTNDYYRFVLSTGSNVGLVLGGLSADADLQLLDGSGSVISGSYNGGSSMDSITASLSAGTYYARVFQYSGDTNYTLGLNGMSSGSDGAGNVTSSANNVGSLNGHTRNFSDWVGSSDTHDYYQFTLNSATTVSLDLTGMTQDGDLYLFNSSGSEITRSWNGGNANEHISRSLAAGTYYVDVRQFSGDTNYSLTMAG